MILVQVVMLLCSFFDLRGHCYHNWNLSVKLTYLYPTRLLSGHLPCLGISPGQDFVYMNLVIFHGVVQYIAQYTKAFLSGRVQVHNKFVNKSGLLPLSAAPVPLILSAAQVIGLVLLYLWLYEIIDYVMLQRRKCFDMYEEENL
jgi:hypothetical protein